MLCMLPRLALRLLAALVPLALAACADALTSGQPVATNAQLQRDYDKTMTKTEQAAAISDLAQEKLKQEQAVQQDNSGQTGTGAPASMTPAATSSKSAVSSKPAAPAATSTQAY
jgi:hypothetical protein